MRKKIILRKILRIFVFRALKKVFEPSKYGLFEILGREARPEVTDIEATRFGLEKTILQVQLSTSTLVRSKIGRRAPPIIF